MPSKDRIDPKLNEWLLDREKLSVTTHQEPGPTASKTEKRAMSAQVLRLAKRTGKDPDAIAREIPAETLRKTKYPVIEVLNPDGTRTFRHDLGITDGPRALLSR